MEALAEGDLVTHDEFLEAGTVAKSTSCFHEDGRCTVTVEAKTYSDLQNALRKIADEIEGEEPREFNVRSLYMNTKPLGDKS